ncbi:MAG: single-stranded DNA-binding protein [Saccharofermentanales bacterium]|jgi:single-strand DNA-binding protein|nr:single-stranded DNA-binding protein [Oscillospiraceae bacterium]
MNKAILMGRLTRDPELRTTQNQIPVCTFTLAIDRRFKNAAGEKQADFIPVVAWRQQAEFASKYFQKGSRMAVVGSIQTRNWDDAEGKRHYMTEVIADEIYFTESRRDGGSDSGQAGGYQAPAGQPANDGFFPSPDDDTSLPFEL